MPLQGKYNDLHAYIHDVNNQQENVIDILARKNKKNS